jgi:hypothetical protein
MEHSVTGNLPVTGATVPTGSMALDPSWILYSNLVRNHEKCNEQY